MIPIWCCLTIYAEGCIVSFSDGGIYQCVPTFEIEHHTKKRVEVCNINLLPSELIGWVKLKESKE